MMVKNTANFKKVILWIRRLRSRYMFTLAAHRTFLELDRARIETYSGKNTAHKNVEIIKKYNYFFIPSKEGVRYYLIIELAKFFEVDPRKDSLTLDHLLNYTEKTLNNLTKEHFIEYHKDKEFLTTNIDQLEEISMSEVKNFRQRIKGNQKKIDIIKDYRDKYIAHDDLSRDEYIINTRDVGILLRLVKDIVDYYYMRLEWGSNIYDNFDKEPVRNTRKVFADLRKYDILEKEAIKERWSLK